MIHALAFAMLAVQNPAVQTVKTLTIDDFRQGAYTVTVAGEGADSHNSYGLTRPHCLFGERDTGFQISGNPHGTTVTFSIGNGEQKFTSPVQAAWHHDLVLFAGSGPFVDLSSADLFFWDFYTNPAGKLPDQMSIYMQDVAGKSASCGNWHIRIGGVYFRRSEFSQGLLLDWKHIRTLILKQDFGTFPNPTTYSLTRFYVSLKPTAVGPLN